MSPIETFIQQLINGLVIGMIYALIALGYTMVYGILKFISIGPIMNISKKIASASEGDILLSEKMKERAMAEIKTEKYKSENVEAYVIKEIRHKDEHKRFLSEFVRRNK